MKFEIEVDAGTMEKVRKIAERREEKLAETVTFLVGTGAGRYIAANKWADNNATPKKPRKAKAPKEKKAAKVKKISKRAAKKAASLLD